MLKNWMKSIVTASFCLAAFAPAGAAPMIVQKPAVEITGASGLVDVQHRDRHVRQLPRDWWRGGNRNRSETRGFYRHNNRGYYNGHRGYRNHRRGYRQYNGYWFPPAAFALGAIIGGAVDNNRAARPGYTNPQHVRLCHQKYRSYREWDNTFQPYNGPRRECRTRFY